MEHNYWSQTCERQKQNEQVVLKKVNNTINKIKKHTKSFTSTTIPDKSMLMGGILIRNFSSQHCNAPWHSVNTSCNGVANWILLRTLLILWGIPGCPSPFIAWDSTSNDSADIFFNRSPRSVVVGLADTYALGIINKHINSTMKHESRSFLVYIGAITPLYVLNWGKIGSGDMDDMYRMDFYQFQWRG